MILNILKVLFLLYLGICVLLYFMQENLIFFPEKLSQDHTFRFSGPFEEISIKTEDHTRLHALLFKADKPKGVVFYLHGNAGSLDSWGEVAQVYTALNYDVFMLDYRGYGKSEGKIRSQAQIYQDVQTAYDTVKTRYKEDDIVVLGYSIGSGPAAKVASDNQPGLLILQAAYYSLGEVMRKYFPIIPTFILKYKFETYKFLERCAMPVVLFHGDRDEIIPVGSSLKLKEVLKPTDELIILKREGHNGKSSNPAYLAALQRILLK